MDGLSNGQSNDFNKFSEDVIDFKTFSPYLVIRKTSCSEKKTFHCHYNIIRSIQGDTLHAQILLINTITNIEPVVPRLDNVIN